MSTVPQASRNWARLLTGELALMVGAVALFTLFMLGLMRWYFPAGTGIEVSERTGAGMIARDAALGLASGQGGARRMVGTLTARYNSVQWRSAEEVEWRRAEEGASFRERDALQTGPASYATVGGGDGTSMRLGERSLVVFEAAAARLAADFSRPAAVVMRGEMSGELAPGAGAADGLVRINGGALSLVADADEPVEYVVRINDNESATISLFRGRARYVSAEGVTEIAERQALTVDDAGRRVELADLPPAPALLAPAAGARIAGRGGPTAVDFTWQAVPGVEGYRVIIARDPQLVNRVADERVAGTAFRHGGLPVGSYYWAVQAGTGWTLGAPGGPRLLVLGKDDQPPLLALDAAPAAVSANYVTISGRTDPDARVFVAGQPAENAAGAFKHETYLAAGANIIVVESVDAVGNVAYASVMVVSRKGD
jgi:hypothetical protein